MHEYLIAKDIISMWMLNNCKWIVWMCSFIACYWGPCLCSLFGKSWVSFWVFYSLQEVSAKQIHYICVSSIFVSWSDYGELGEKQTEGSGAVHPRPPHEHPGHCGGGHCRPARSQPVSDALDPRHRLGNMSAIVLKLQKRLCTIKMLV